MRLLLFVVFSVGIAWADQVTLTNGDRITGSVLRSDTKVLVLKTDNAGEQNDLRVFSSLPIGDCELSHVLPRHRGSQPLDKESFRFVYFG